MDTLLAMLWGAANIIAVIYLIKMIIERVKHGKTEKLADLSKKFFIAFAAATVSVIIAAVITPHSPSKSASTMTPVPTAAATASQEPSAVAETPEPTIETTPTPSATPMPTPSAAPSETPISTPAPVYTPAATPTPQVESAPQVAEQSNAQADTHEYVLNTSSRKFHKPTCSSVNTMNESNREDVTSTRDELIAQGYEPCQRCNP